MLQGLVDEIREISLQLQALTKRKVSSNLPAYFANVVVPSSPPFARIPVPTVLSSKADVPYELAMLLEAKVLPQLAQAAHTRDVLELYDTSVPDDQQLARVPELTQVGDKYSDPAHLEALRHLGGLFPFLVELATHVHACSRFAAKWPSSWAKKRLRASFSRIESLARALPVIFLVSPQLSRRIGQHTRSPHVVAEDGEQMPFELMNAHHLNVVMRGGIWAFWFDDSPEMNKIKTTVAITAASVHRLYKRSTGIGKVVTGLSFGSYYKLFQDKAMQEYERLIREGDAEFWSAFWSLQTTPFVAFFDSLRFPPIRVNNMYHVPMPPATEESLALSPDPPAFLAFRVLCATPLPDAVAHGLAPYRDAWTHATARDMPALYDAAAPPSPELPRVPVIFHLHGGGFVALSSGPAQAYTRVWANQCAGAVVFSLDYALAPTHKHPVAIDQCFALYSMLMAGSFGFLPSPIVVVGESAGGNLAASVALRAVHQAVPPPSGLQLQYPAMILRNLPSPARILASGDPVLPAPSLKVRREAYVPKSEQGPYDPDMEKQHVIQWLNPGSAPDQYISQFPPTRILVGDFDPLLDDSVDFANRLQRLGVLCDLHCYHGMAHGYLNYGRFLTRSKELIVEAGSLLRADLGMEPADPS